VAEETVRALLAKALRREKELRFELETLQRMIDGYRRLQLMQDEDPDAEQLHLWHGASRRALKSEEVEALLEEVRQIILRERRPMTRSELVNQLESRGHQLAGKDKKKVLGTNIWRSGKFEHWQGKGYWPRGVDEPLATGIV
jgi:hypothetical protein